jgi:hypothetical protein
MRMGRRYVGTSIAFAIVPAAVVPAVLILGGESPWPAVLTYHALCVALPLASRCSLKEAGFVLADVRARLPVPEQKRFVYVLKSGNSKPHFYVGLTSDVRARLSDHNDGRCPHAVKWRPWQMHVVVEFPDEPRSSL